MGSLLSYDSAPSADVARDDAPATHRVPLTDPVRAILVIGLLPNLIALPTAIWGSRAFFHIEYILLAAFERFLPRTAVAVTLGLLLGADLLITFAPVFNFGPADLPGALEQLAHFQARTMAFAVAVVVSIALLAFGLTRLRGQPVVRTGNRRQQLRMGATLVATLCLIDLVNGSNAIGWRASTLLPLDPSASIAASEYMYGWANPPKAGDAMEAAADLMRDEIVNATDTSWKGPEKVVFVVMESMGVPRGATLEQMFAPFMNDDIRRRYTVRMGTVQFAGATTAGEFRELCGIKMTHTAVRKAKLPQCLPARFRDLGYETFGMHGYKGRLFQRNEWYPRIGFQRTLFREELQRDYPVANCGLVFYGVCDSSLTPILRRELTRDPKQRQFLYWLTLTSHFPLPKAHMGSEGCVAVGKAGQTREVCQLWGALWSALSGVAGLASDTTVPPAWYLIVGDHTPPQLLSEGYNHPSYPPRDRPRPSRFMEERLPFSTEEVPFIELRPIEMPESVEWKRASRYLSRFP